MASSQSQTLKEIRLLRTKVERLEALIEERLLPISKPFSDEVEAAEDYVRNKRAGHLEFEKLEKLERP